MDWMRILAYVTRMQNKYLAAENHILKAKLQWRQKLTDAERGTLGEIGYRMGHKVLSEVANVARRGTILAWYRKLVAHKFDGSKARLGSGRPQMTRQVERLLVHMANENRNWSYDRATGALPSLGLEVCDQTVDNALRRHALSRAPERKHTTSWAAFIQMHLAFWCRPISSPRRYSRCADS